MRWASPKEPLVNTCKNNNPNMDINLIIHTEKLQALSQTSQAPTNACENY